MSYGNNIGAPDNSGDGRSSVVQHGSMLQIEYSRLSYQHVVVDLSGLRANDHDLCGLVDDDLHNQLHNLYQLTTYCSNCSRLPFWDGGRMEISNQNLYIATYLIISLLWCWL